MKKFIIGGMFLLMLIVGLKDGRMWEIPGNPPIKFDKAQIKGQMVDCAIVIIDGQGYAFPISMLDLLIYKPEYTI